MQINQLPTAYQPEGALGGIFAGINAANAQTANDLGFEQSILENLIKQKDAAVAQNQMQSAPWMQSQIDKDVGAANKVMAEGDIAQATKDSSILAKNAENAASSREAKIKERLAEFQDHYMKAQELAKLNEQFSGVQFNDALLRLAPKFGMDQNAVQQLINMPESDRTDMLLSQLHQARGILQSSPALVAKAREYDLKEQAEAGMKREQIASNEKIAAGHDTSHEKVAAAQRAQAELHHQERMKNEARAETQRAIAALKIEDGNLDTQIKAEEKRIEFLTMLNPKPGTEQHAELAAAKARMTSYGTRQKQIVDEFKSLSKGGDKKETPDVIDADAMLAARKAKQPTVQSVAAPVQTQRVPPAVVQQPPQQTQPSLLRSQSNNTGLRFEPKYTPNGYILSDGTRVIGWNRAVAAQKLIEEQESRRALGPFGIKPGASFQEVGE